MVWSVRFTLVLKLSHFLNDENKTASVLILDPGNRPESSRARMKPQIVVWVSCAAQQDNKLGFTVMEIVEIKRFWRP